MKITTIISAVLAIALSTTAFAYASLSGPSGGTNLPDANVPVVGTGQIADDFLLVSNHNSMIVRGIYGIATNLEVGVAGYIDIDNHGGDNNAIGVNAKYQLTNLGLQSNDKVAVGINYQDANGSFHDTSIYVVGTRQFTEIEADKPALSASVGLNYNSAPGSTSLRPYITADARYKSGLNINAELQLSGSDYDSNPMYALTARFPINNNWNAEAGITNSNLGTYGTSSTGVILGATYSFDKIY